MPDNAIDTELFREERLAVLFSLGWRILWLPLGILFPLPYLLRHPTILVFACGTYAAVIVWKLASVSRLFRRMDVLTLCFGLLSSYAVGFIVFLFVRPPEPSDLTIASALYVMGMTFVSVGCVMVVSPQAAARLNELTDGKIRLGPMRATHSLHIWMRIGGVFLTSTGALLLAVAAKITLEAVSILRH